MSDPPVQRPVSRDEFRSLLDAFKVSDDAIVIHDAFGYGVKEAANGDQIDHDLASAHGVLQLSNLAYPLRPGRRVTFGPMKFPEYQFPITPHRVGSMPFRYPADGRTLARPRGIAPTVSRTRHIWQPDFR